ncbi:hypothetical protein TELCIR_12236 [Teladorsagia circumcincta]|uniref:Uncharacterized protein n=1 Tax=Teladorsagia circumcincta TaxID=45464 RepID=A0A2G9U7A6_TELCI|nr:hypothetical protein TELCIR_12236 [Teladorsagia circumcincta]
MDTVALDLRFEVLGGTHHGVVLRYFELDPRRLIRLVILIATVIFLIFYYIQGMNEDDGKQATGSIASAAQIAGSLVCPYLIARNNLVEIKHD